MYLNLRGQRGDSIVEVIIVLAVLSLALSIAYATSNQSLLATRQAQENSQATEILRSQLETLRSYTAVDSTSANYIFRATKFCIDSGGAVKDIIPAGPCTQRNLYDIAIQYVASSGTGSLNTFTATATWADAQGHGDDVVTLVYRLRP